MVNLIGIVWDPTIIGYLAVSIGVVVLCGSVYLLLATNLGTRLGFLVALSGLAGWFMLMGIVWWVYGIGLKGGGPEWRPVEVTTSMQISRIDKVRDLGRALDQGSDQLPDGWHSLPPEEKGDVVAAASSAVTCAPGDERLSEPVNNCLFSGTSEFTDVGTFEVGGRRYRPLGIPNNVVTDFLIPSRGTPHYVVVQVQPYKPAGPVDLNAENPPPPPELDPNAPVYDIILVRHQGNLRFPPAMITIMSTLLFAVTAYQLHRRDLAAMAARAASSV